MPIDESEWETLHELPSCGVLVIGDEDLATIPDALGGTMLVMSDDNRGAVFAFASCDGLPIETVTRRDELVGVRAEFTDDIRDLEANREGLWERVGQFRTEDGVVAGDAKLLDNDDFAVDVPLADHAYVIDEFVSDGECLGIRVIAEAYIV